MPTGSDNFLDLKNRVQHKLIAELDPKLDLTRTDEVRRQVEEIFQRHTEVERYRQLTPHLIGARQVKLRVKLCQSAYAGPGSTVARVVGCPCALTAGHSLRSQDGPCRVAAHLREMPFQGLAPCRPTSAVAPCPPVVGCRH